MASCFLSSAVRDAAAGWDDEEPCDDVETEDGFLCSTFETDATICLRPARRIATNDCFSDVLLMAVKRERIAKTRSKLLFFEMLIGLPSRFACKSVL